MRSGIDEAVAAAKQADTAVLVVGSKPFINGREAHDRTSMALGAGQEALVKAVVAANPHTVVVLQTSYPDDDHLGPARTCPASSGPRTPGAETGHAIADVLYGDGQPGRPADPDLAGSADSCPPTSTSTTSSRPARPTCTAGRRRSTRSATACRTRRFKYGKPVVGNGVRSASEVTNTGKRDGDEVVQLYTHQRTSRDVTAVKQLRAFDRVHVKAGQTRSVTLPLRAGDLAHWDVTRGKWVVESSVYDILIGASSSDIRQRTAIDVRGETIPARDLSRVTRAESFDRYAPAVKLVDESKASRHRGRLVAGGRLDRVQGREPAQRRHVHGPHREGHRGRHHRRGPPRLAHRPAARHRAGGLHRRRLQLRHDHRDAGPGRRAARRLPGVRRQPPAVHILHSVRGESPARLPGQRAGGAPSLRRGTHEDRSHPARPAPGRR